ncbi:hypothetical protein KDW_37640 [Dictyobacter vulcani]|uniref:YtxH domain-containing protein n=1 Tax=Dictyobacter vulcani TaxID=2607529 RepID=A0A5J4KR27_9CHLR|nr:YtxH domain-containing protein [Dictyobacter vulcani]GER89602.1 hypothetical protein KDW_37640 [Dictyobacter vulcani]
MGKFLQGLLVGAAAGMLVAPMKGEELRNQLKGRIKELQDKVSNSNLTLPSLQEQRNNYTKNAKVEDGEPITLPVETFEKPATSSVPSPMKNTQPSATSSVANNTTDSTSTPASASSPTYTGTAKVASPKPFISSDQTESKRPAPLDTTSTTAKPDISTNTGSTQPRIPTPGTTQPRRYTYDRTLGEEDNEPITLPVETFENPKPAQKRDTNGSANSSKNSLDPNKRVTNSVPRSKSEDKPRKS